MNQESTIYLRELNDPTRVANGRRDSVNPQMPGLTILAHPNTERIGERLVLSALTSGGEVLISRLEPGFTVPVSAGAEAASRRRPLADLHLSRNPFRLQAAPGGGIVLAVSGTKTEVAADGVPILESRSFSAEQVARGVVLLVAGRIALLLHILDPLPVADVPHFGLVGESAAIVALRRDIARVAELDVPALLRGETGTGKDMTAQAIHQASPRRDRPLVAVNMAAIPPDLAAAELFGVEESVSVAGRSRTGYFGRATGGTLFLDEIGAMPVESQALLLRTLESQTIQPLGAEQEQKVDVRILAATDADLGAEVEKGRFRAPLLHRLSGYELRLAPLRQRRDDIGRLLLHFFRQELEARGEIWRLDSRNAAEPWLDAMVVARLAAYSWPGNVRQLRNVARQLVVGNLGAPYLTMTSSVEQLFLEDTGARLSLPAVPPVPAAIASSDEMENRAILKTLLLVDLVDSTKMVKDLGDRRALEVMSRHDRMARSLLAEYGGYEIDKSDGFLLLFERPIDALGYALEYHESLAELSRELGLEIRARAGIHPGDVFLRRNAAEEVARGAKAFEVEGLAKPVAARLMSLAAGGQTLLTRSAFDLARQSARGDHPLAAPEIRWLNHGKYRLKGIEEAVEIFEVGIDGIAPLSTPQDTEKAVRHSPPPPASEAT